MFGEKSQSRVRLTGNPLAKAKQLGTRLLEAISYHGLGFRVSGLGFRVRV